MDYMCEKSREHFTIGVALVALVDLVDGRTSGQHHEIDLWDISARCEN